MIRTDTFSGYHPIVSFLYFGIILAFAMIFTHPVCVAVSLVCGLLYAIYLNGRKAIRFNVVFMLPMLLFTAVLNPLFNHQGGTIITYLPNGNPLTLESIAYGIMAAGMLGAVVTWFSCFNAVITSDKLVYLFGRIIPAFSLIFTMALRFVPRFIIQIKHISNAQKCLGHDISSGSIRQKAKHGITILSVMVTWALENAVETADSMKARGYGLPGRTVFSLYCFNKRDGYALFFIVGCAVYIITGGIAGGLYFRYFPTFSGIWNTTYTISIFMVYAMLNMMPVWLNIKEDVYWTCIQSSI